MMKTLRSLIILIFVSGVIAQDDGVPWNMPTESDFPTLAQTASKCEGFAPKGWAVLAKAEGDLNGDGIADCAAIFNATESRFIFKNDGFGTSEFDTNPRILAVAFADGDRGFRLHVQNNSFAISAASPTMIEPFQDMTIKGGVLTFLFEEFYSAGSWSMSNQTYKFRYQNGEMTLIGVDKTTTIRNTGDIEMRSYNLSTGQMTIELGHIDDDGKGEITRKPIRIQPLPTLRNVKPMFTWEIEEDVVL